MSNKEVLKKDGKVIFPITSTKCVLDVNGTPIDEKFITTDNIPKEIHIGQDEPTDPNVKIWIDTTPSNLVPMDNNLEKRVKDLEDALGGSKIVFLTEEEYKAINIKDPKTTYVVKE